MLPAFQHPRQFFEHKSFVSLGIDTMIVLWKTSQPGDVS